MKKRLLCGAIILLLAATLMSGIVSADAVVPATVSAGSISAVLADDEDVITITIDNLWKIINSQVQPGDTKTATFTVQNDTGSDYVVTGYKLKSTFYNPTRVVNKAMEAYFSTLGKDTTNMRNAINGLTADQYWDIIDDYYSTIDSNWQNNESLVSEVLASNGYPGQGNSTNNKVVSQKYVDLAESYFEKYVYLSFNNTGADLAKTAGAKSSLAAYETGSNASWVLGCFETITDGSTMSNGVGLHFDGPKLGNAFMGAHFEISIELTLTKKNTQTPPPPDPPEPPVPAGTVTVETERLDGQPYNSGDEFTVTLSQSGVVKYSYLLNGANSWSFGYSDVVPGVYDVAQSNIASGYSLVSISAPSGYNQLTDKLTVADGDDLTVTVINKVDTIPPPNSPAGTVTVETERLDGQPYKSGDEFTVTLSQSGVVKYSYLLNGANSWSFGYSDVVPGVYDVAQSNIASGYSLVSISAPSGYNQLTGKLTVADGDDLTVTVINKVDSIQTPNPPPKDKEKATPKTGDESNIVLLIALAGGSVIIVVGLVVILLLLKKRDSGDNKSKSGTKLEAKKTKKSDRKVDE